MPLDPTALRIDNYTFGSFDTIADTLEFDYESINYDYFRKVINGAAETGIQLGALLAQNIVFWSTAFEIGLLPTAVVTGLDGKHDDEVSKFVNDWLSDQHGKLIEICETKNEMGDVYVAFNLDRNLEAIQPDRCDPGFLPYSQGLASLRVIQNKYVRNIDTGRKVKMKITRNYTDKEITYESELQTKSKYTVNIKVPDKIKVTNPLDTVPVILIPNLKKAGKAFGYSELYWALPYFELYHKTLVRGFEAQQYSGKPILTISGIEGDVASWFLRTFGIDVTEQGTDALDTTLINFYKRYQLLALAGNVTAEFVESKTPTGKTKEILDIVIGLISQVTGIPEFLFGGSSENMTDSLAREQLLTLKARTEIKQVKLNDYLIQLIKMAMVWYNHISKNEETGETLEKIGLVSQMSDTNKYRIKLIWPEIISSDGKLKNEVFAMMLNAGAVSRLSTLKNYQSYVPNPEEELKQIEAEREIFGDLGNVPQTSAQKNSKQRRRNDKSNQNTGDDADRPELEDN